TCGSASTGVDKKAPTNQKSSTSALPTHSLNKKRAACAILSERAERARSEGPAVGPTGSLRGDPHHHDAVRRHGRAEAAGERAEVRVSPDVTHASRSANGEGTPGRGDHGLQRGTVQEYHRARAV